MVFMITVYTYPKLFSNNDFSVDFKSLCNENGGEWDEELNLCVNLDKETCESFSGHFQLFENYTRDVLTPDDVESFCFWKTVS